MQKLFLIGGAVCIFVALLAYSEWGLGATLFVSFIGVIFVILGLAGEKP